MASKSDPKPDLLIICSGSLTLSSRFQSKQASTSEVASEFVCSVGNLSYNPSQSCGDGMCMVLGRRSTKAPKSPATRNNEIYEQSDDLSLDCLGGPCGYTEPNFMAALG